MDRVTIAIDPGAAGGFAWTDDFKHYGVVDLPAVENMTDFLGLRRLIVETVEGYDEALIYVEDQHPRPGNASTSVFLAGRNYQIIFNAIMVANEDTPKVGFMIELINPVSWKMRFGVTVRGNVTTKIKKEKTLHKLEDVLGFDWCAANLLGKRGGYKDGRGDSLGILIAMGGRK